MRFMMFSKHLQSLPLLDAGKALMGLGFEGIDLTVRPGGYVEPPHVKRALPEAVKRLREAGLVVPLATTAITHADDVATATFHAAREAGVREIKLGYVPYGDFLTFQRTLDQAARDLDGIERLARATGVRANLHSHSGPYLTANPAVMWWLLKDRDPEAIGAYVDPGHMTIEGGRDGWRMGLDILATRITLVAVKDLAWMTEPDESLGKPRWVSQIVPLREGIVRWPGVFACLARIGFEAWVSLHSEYQGWHSWRELSVQELLSQTREDLLYLREAIDRAAAGTHLTESDEQHQSQAKFRTPPNC
jgi:sugar phosphate isomerase/epimerase